MDAYTDWLSDYLDGSLDEGKSRELERHLGSCPSCRALAADLRRIKEAATSLERLRPSEELWPRIAGRLRAEPRPRSQPSSGEKAPWMPQGRRWLIAALPIAAAIVLASAMAVRWWMPASAPPPEAATVSSPAAGSAEQRELVNWVESELRLAEQHYENAISGLEKIVAEDESVLDPEVGASLKKSLAMLDQAIDESRAGLRSRPQSQVAQESLLEALRRKLALLQDTIVLINEMRDGRVETGKTIQIPKQSG